MQHPAGLGYVAARVAKLENGTTTYYQSDHLSVRVLTNANGTVVGELGHYPGACPERSRRGETWYETGTQTTKEKFTTGVYPERSRRERDGESGNDYTTGRTYASNLGRFLSPDLAPAALGDPQSWNRYTYVQNDPVNRTDPSGWCGEGNYDPTSSGSGNCGGGGEGDLALLGEWADPFGSMGIPVVDTAYVFGGYSNRMGDYTLGQLFNMVASGEVDYFGTIDVNVGFMLFSVDTTGQGGGGGVGGAGVGGNPFPAPNIQPPPPLECTENWLNWARHAYQNALDRAKRGVYGPEAGFTTFGNPARPNNTGIFEGEGGHVSLPKIPGMIATFHAHPPSYPGHPSGFGRLPSIPGEDESIPFEGRLVPQYVGSDAGLFVSDPTAPGGYQTSVSGSSWLTQNPCHH